MLPVPGVLVALRTAYEMFVEKESVVVDSPLKTPDAGVKLMVMSWNVGLSVKVT